MSLYAAYLEEIDARAAQGLSPKPVDDGELTKEIIAQIKDADHAHRADSLKYLIYNTLPGTTSAAGEKARFLKEVVLGDAMVEEISVEFAFELLSHMKSARADSASRFTSTPTADSSASRAFPRASPSTTPSAVRKSKPSSERPVAPAHAQRTTQT